MIDERLETIHHLIGKSQRYLEIMSHTADLLEEAGLPKELYDKIQLTMVEREWYVSKFFYKQGVKDGIKLIGEDK